jgi:hypothetical protein
MSGKKRKKPFVKKSRPVELNEEEALSVEQTLTVVDSLSH